jgi:hypothetical protein
MEGMTTQTTKIDVRRAVLAVTISSFTLAALMGIGALMGGDFGETSVRVLLTTVVVGCASVVTLCCLTVVGGRFQVVGIAGFALAVVTACLGLVLVWGSADDLGERMYETFGVAVTASLTIAQVCLLLGLAGARRALAPLMLATIGLALVVGAMASSLIVGYVDSSSGFWRGLGTIAILDVLGTLVTIAIGVFGRDDRAVSITLSPLVAARVRHESETSGRPVNEVVDQALARYFDVSVG